MQPIRVHVEGVSKRFAHRVKGEIYAGLRPHGVAVVNEDDPHAPYWKSLNVGRRIVTFVTWMSSRSTLPIR